MYLPAHSVDMKLRGRRECQDCGERWSYFETGEITCPTCGSVRSKSVAGPTEHTAGTVTLDLTPVRALVDTKPIREVADKAANHTRAYLREVGFIEQGELQELDETVLAASELRRVGRTLGRVLQPTDAEKQYFLTLLRDTDSGERPAPETVPESLYPERGLAITASVDIYRSELRTVIDNPEPTLDRALSQLDTHLKRVNALDGAVNPKQSERLVTSIRDISEYVRTDDETALTRAVDRLDSLERL